MSRLAKIRSHWPNQRIQALPGVMGAQGALGLQITPDEVWDMVLDADPTPQKKMTGWIFEAWERQTFRFEDLTGGEESMVGETLSAFETYRKSRVFHDMLSDDAWSLLKYRGPGDIEEVIRPCREKEMANADQALGVSGREEKRRVSLLMRYESWQKEFPSGLKVIMPFTKRASCFYGQNTRWCTAASKNNMFDTYIGKGPMTIFVLPDGERFQAWASLNGNFEEIDFMDEMDRPLGQENSVRLQPFKADIKEVWSHFNSYGDIDRLVANFISKKDTTSIHYPNIVLDEFPSYTGMTKKGMFFDELIDAKTFDDILGISRSISIPTQVSIEKDGSSNYVCMAIRVALDDIEKISFPDIPRGFAASTIVAEHGYSTQGIPDKFYFAPMPGEDAKAFYAKFARHLEQNPDMAGHAYTETMTHILSWFPEKWQDLINSDRCVIPSLQSTSDMGGFTIDREYAKKLLVDNAAKMGALTPVARQNRASQNRRLVETIIARASLTCQDMLETGVVSENMVMDIMNARIRNVFWDDEASGSRKAKKVLSIVKEMPEDFMRKWHLSPHNFLSFSDTIFVVKNESNKSAIKALMKMPEIIPDTSFKNLDISEIRDLIQKSGLIQGEDSLPLYKNGNLPLLTEGLLSSLHNLAVHSGSLKSVLKVLFEPEYVPENDKSMAVWSFNDIPGIRDAFQTSLMVSHVHNLTSEDARICQTKDIDKFQEVVYKRKFEEASRIWKDPEICEAIAMGMSEKWLTHIRKEMSDIEVKVPGTSPEPR